MNKSFSLIMATYGREKEVDAFLESIRNCDYEKILIEIIIVDQNDTISLDKIIESYKSELDIKHLKSSQKGLALNRNKGLEIATGEIVAFPDDDCEYLHETIPIINKYFSNNEIDVCMGRIIERDGKDSLRSWPKENLDITKTNFYTKCSSITMFFKNDKTILKLDDNLGVGQKFGSCEDTDLLYRFLLNNKKVVYRPDIKIYHPHYDSNNNMTKEKIELYGLGFGGFCKKNMDGYIALLTIKVLVYHILKWLIFLVLCNFEKSNRSRIAFISRIKGYFQWNN